MKNAIVLFCVFFLIIPLLQGAPKKTAKVPQAGEWLFQKIHYREIGPTRQSGRFVDFAVHPKKTYIFYAATGSGGLWKTVNNGITFEPLFDKEENVFSIGDIALAPSQPETIWVGTGEANNSRSTYWGNGIYKSSDAGKTWKHMGLDDTHHIARILVHPSNPEIVYVAAMGHLYTDNPERGLFKSTDGGQTWSKVLEVKVKGHYVGATDLVFDPANPEILYAAMYDRLRKPWTYMIGGVGSGIYKTIDGGKTWKKLAGGLPEGVIGRIGIDIYKKNPKILYACIENANKPDVSVEEREKEILEGKSSDGMIDGEVYRSDDAGETWKKVNKEKENIGGAPGYYYGQIIVDPNDDKVVHVLSAASWGTRDGGVTWQRRPLRFGGDDHALWIDPDNSDHMLLGYDHGLGITYDGGKNWLHPDNLPLAQFYSIGFDMSRPYNVAGGMQDNGSVVGPSTGKDGQPLHFEDWRSVGGGDGMYNVFDTRTNRYLYNESQFGVISRYDLKTGEEKSIGYLQKNPKLRFNWCAPILVSPHDSDMIFHGANVLLKSPFRGEYWEEISTDLTGNDASKMGTGKGGDGNIQYCTITTIDESILQQGLLWVGTDDGYVQVSRDGGKKWENASVNITGNPGYWVSRVVASRHALGTAYVSYTGFRNDDFRPFLYKTIDFGKTWTSIAGNLPEASVNVIREGVENPDLLFVGTELGVYVSLDSGKKWIPFMGDMPTQPVHDLKVHPREKELIVGTHGRGIFITDIAALEECTPEVLAADLNLFSVQPFIQWIRPLRRMDSSANFNGGSVSGNIPVHYYLRQEIAGGIVVKIYQGDRLLSEIKGQSESGIQSVTWDRTARRPRTEEEKKAFQRMKERFAQYGYPMRGDPDYIQEPVGPGKYRVELWAGKMKRTGEIEILSDPEAQ